MARANGSEKEKLNGSEKEIARLERKHQRLKELVAEYEGRLYLTPEEQRRLTELKKEKLATKDALFALRQSMNGNSS
ncbi:MAG: YdcH family protein [Deltaproteobacteria bacterium]|nr:YdcH family protein [Sandaracinaceae bacterium]MCX7808260.1 YdcH family protein [Deltaproteobacteria bacterium]MDW8245154.1 YdcH family protein [Sandaracinaceae bacterium]